MPRFPEWTILTESECCRVDAAADEAVRAGTLVELAAVLEALAPFEGVARRALLRTLLREHFEACEAADRPLPVISAYLKHFADDSEQAVVREVFAEQLPTLSVEIVREIGRGGMGVVYEARQASLGNRRVAVKTIDSTALQHAALWLRLREEVDALAQLHSQNIVTVHQVGLLDGRVAFVMELAERNLEQMTASRPQDQRESAEIVRLLALAVQSAHEHSKRIIHRDLKPSNVLVMSDGAHKIADFGLLQSAKKAPAHHSAAVVGSPGYLAPEQAKGEATTFATDVWGLGGILHYLLTGAPPFEKRRDRIEDVVSSQLPPPSLRRLQAGGDALDPRLDAVLCKCLMKSPNERYEQAIELARDLQRFLQEKEVLAPPPPHHRPKNSRVPWIVGATALVLAVCSFPLLRDVFLPDPDSALRPSPSTSVASSDEPAVQSPEMSNNSPPQEGATVSTSSDRSLASRLEQSIDAMRPLARRVENACQEFRSQLDDASDLALPEFKTRWQELIARQPPVTGWMLDTLLTRVESLHRAIGTEQTSQALKQLSAEVSTRQTELEEFGAMLDRDLAALDADLKKKRLARVDPPAGPPPTDKPNSLPDNSRTASKETDGAAGDTTTRRSPHEVRPPANLTDQSKEAPMSAADVVFFTRSFDRDFSAPSTQFTLNVDDASDVWLFVPTDLEPEIRSDPKASFLEDWMFEWTPVAGRGVQKEFRFKRALRARYNAGGQTKDVTLDERGSSCSGEVARRFWTKGKYHFIAEPKRMSLHHQTRPYAESPGRRAQDVKFYWAGSTKNHYSLSLSDGNALVWSLVPLNE